MEYLQETRSEICHILDPSHFSLHYRPICGTPASDHPSAAASRPSATANQPSAAASWTSSTANRPSESTNRPSAAASRPSESAIPSTTTKPLHDDYQFRRHNDRKSSNMTNASSSRRRKRPSMMTGPIAAASRQSLRLPQAHLETSSRPPLSMAVRSPSRHPRALHHNDPTRPTMTDSATPPSSVTYESGTKSGTDAAQT